jgi:hypothetical protein
LSQKGRTAELVSSLEGLEKEARTVYGELVVPHWDDAPQALFNRFVHTLYGFVMVCFSRIDLLSAYWRGNSSTQGQSERMIDFMQKYGVSTDREACDVAVQIWRHKLMHTAEPRMLIESGSGITYLWLLHWSADQLPRDKHFVLTQTGGQKILNIALVCLIEDLRRALNAYLADLSSDTGLQSSYQRIDAEMQSKQKFRLRL